MVGQGDKTSIEQAQQNVRELAPRVPHAAFRFNIKRDEAIIPRQCRMVLRSSAMRRSMVVDGRKTELPTEDRRVKEERKARSSGEAL